MTRSYYGPLRVKSSKQLVESYPIIFFREDSSGTFFNLLIYTGIRFLGGWSRLKNRLSSNNLVFEGEKVPSNASALKPALDELIRACQAEGVDMGSFCVPAKALPFSTLISRLEASGAIQPVGGPIPGPSAGPSPNLPIALPPGPPLPAVPPVVQPQAPALLAQPLPAAAPAIERQAVGLPDLPPQAVPAPMIQPPVANPAQPLVAAQELALPPAHGPHDPIVDAGARDQAMDAAEERALLLAHRNEVLNTLFMAKIK